MMIFENTFIYLILAEIFVSLQQVQELLLFGCGSSCLLSNLSVSGIQLTLDPLTLNQDPSGSEIFWSWGTSWTQPNPSIRVNLSVST